MNLEGVMACVFGKRGAKYYLPFLFFSFVAIVWWFPVISHFGTNVAGVGGDPYQTSWRIVKLGEAVRQGSLTVAEESTFPNISPLPWLPVYYLFGEIVAYNTAWLLSAILAGYFGFLLARKWGAYLWPSVMAGLMIEFAPYRIAQSLGHFGAMQIWVILAALFSLTAWNRKSARGWLLLTLFFTLVAAWTDHQLFIVLMIVYFVFGAGYWRQLRRLNYKMAISLLVAPVIVIVIAIFPFWKSAVNVATGKMSLNLGNTQRQAYSANLRSLLLSPAFLI